MDNPNNFIDRINKINTLSSHNQLLKNMEIVSAQQYYIDSFDHLIDSSVFESASSLAQGLAPVISNYSSIIEQVQIPMDTMAQSVNSLVENINFDRTINIVENLILNTNELTDFLNNFYKNNYESIAKNLANWLDSVTLNHVESIENILSGYSELDSFSDTEKEQLLEATEFVSYQFIQTFHNFEQNTEFSTNPNINQANQTNYDTNSQHNNLNKSMNENHSHEITMQNESPSLIKTVFNVQNIYNEIASILHTLVTMQLYYWASGYITLDDFLELIDFLVSIFIHQ